MNNPYDVKAEPKVEAKPPEPNNLDVPADGELEKLSLARSLGMDNLKELSKYSDQLERLVEWAKLKGAKSREDVIWEVRQLANRVGGPSIGNNNVQHLSQYAYLEMERLKLDKQMKEMAVNG